MTPPELKVGDRVLVHYLSRPDQEATVHEIPDGPFEHGGMKFPDRFLILERIEDGQPLLFPAAREFVSRREGP